MKHLLLTLAFVFIFPILSPAQIYSNGTGGGAWNNPLTWAGGSIPTSSDNVIIETGDVVTISSIQSCYALTINGVNAASYGTLTLNTGAQLSTSGHTNVYGKLLLVDGIFNEGNSSGDKLIVNGTSLGSSCLLSISGGTLNVSRYFALSNSSSFEMTGGTVNVNSSGGSSSTDIFYIPSGTTFTMSSGTINILNGNLGSGVAVKFNPTTSNVTGGTIKFTNTKNYASTTLISNNTLYNINCEVSSGNKLIIQNMPSSGDGFDCQNFTVTSGSAQIDPGYGMTVSNTLTNNDSLIIASDATGNGSLILNGTFGGNNIITQRYISGYTSGDNGWHLISSPVNAFTISGSDFEPGTGSPDLDDFFAWDEPTNSWLNYKDGTNNITQFTSGNGYLIAYETTATKEFNGSPSTSDLTLNNLSYNVSQGNGWHLLGNPYLSAITWGDANWSLTNVAGTAKLWNESSGNYLDISSGGTIPSTNGFFIQITSATNSLTIPAADRIHDATNNFKSSELHQNNLKFKITNDANTYYDESTLGFKTDATEAYDPSFDSHKLFSFVRTAPQIWTVSNNEAYSTNYISQSIENISIPVDFRAGINSTYHLSWTSPDSMDIQLEILLEDKLKGTIINMRDFSDYDFNATIHDDTQRFSLNINGTNRISQNSENIALVYALNSDVYIKAKNNRNLNGRITFNNILGQVVYHAELNGTSQQIIRTQLNSGIYIVRLEMVDGTIATHKLVIKQ